jgi:hypothetical protein
MKKISEYDNITTVAEADVLPIVDVSDTEQASTGSTRKGSIEKIADYLKARVETLTNKTLTTPKINEDVTTTATSSELNKLDGTDVVTADLNKLHDITATAAEINQLDDVEVGGTGSGDIVTIGDTQTLTNKTITDSTISDYYNEDQLDFLIGEESLQIDTDSMDAFGILIKVDSDNAIYFFREATDHDNDKGKIVGQKYTFSTMTWGTRFDVYDDANANYDVRNASGGVIGSNIYLFLARNNYTSHPTLDYVDVGYIKSTDLTGTSWSSFSTIENANFTGWGSAYSHLVETGTPGKYIQPIYGWSGAGPTYYVQFFETTDSGDTWTLGDTIYSGSTDYTETSVARINDSKMVALIRENSGNYVYQSVSSDDGETWSAPEATNLGPSSGVKVPYLIYSEPTNRLIALYKDRTYPYPMKISDTDADEVYASASSWNKTRNSPVGIVYSQVSGYPSMVPITGRKFFYVFFSDISASDADTYGGVYELEVHKDSFVGCSVYLNANQSIPNGELTKVGLNTKNFDIGSNFDTTNKRFVAPVSGYYQVNTSIEYDGVVDTNYYTLIYVNGADAGSAKASSASSSNPDPTITLSRLVFATAGQYIELYAYNEGDGAVNAKGTNIRTYMTIHLVGST